MVAGRSHQRRPSSLLRYRVRVIMLGQARCRGTRAGPCTNTRRMALFGCTAGTLRRRVAFGLGRSRAAGPDGRTEASRLLLAGDPARAGPAGGGALRVRRCCCCSEGEGEDCRCCRRWPGEEEDDRCCCRPAVVGLTLPTAAAAAAAAAGGRRSAAGGGFSPSLPAGAAAASLAGSVGAARRRGNAGRGRRPGVCICILTVC